MNLPNEVKFLTREQVVLMHEQCMDDFGGLKGIRDENLLMSSLGQPMQTYDGVYLYDSIFLMAAAYLFYFAKNHCFLDGNKRIALKTCYHFLNLNKIDLMLSNQEFYELILCCIKNEMDIDDIAVYIENNALYKS